ncbi:stage III sporulation protein SpoIIIAB [Lutispora thermophila]|uniref:Stage III sporulation protein AB n=1 Tax=Lutispora thermophila DSM 19022 TaxID=1122184 RepID=A0A1M6F4Q9_9FIRM|nr:stage III sporulation protein SpoIIIAB [Lutispora thermophila]SHI92675.1 stage III sporulation protein AB [Lutispora thermophila DSM 19022]
MLKGIGALLIIISSSLLGILISSKYSIRPKEIRKLRFSLQMLETEIVYGSTPIPYACYNVGCKSDKPWKDFFMRVSENLLKRKFFSLEEAWNDAIVNSLKNSYLTSADKELLRNFGRVIGKSDTEDQKKHFKLIYAQLEHHEKIAEDEKARNEKMYKSMGFLLGAAILIILV